MWNLEKQENSYCHATRLTHIGPQANRNTPQNRQFYDIKFLNLGMKPKH